MIPLFMRGAKITPAVETLAATVMLICVQREGHTGTRFVKNRDQEDDAARDIRKRRAAIYALADQGLTVSQIGLRVHVHRWTITNDLLARRKVAAA